MRYFDDEFVLIDGERFELDLPFHLVELDDFRGYSFLQFYSAATTIAASGVGTRFLRFVIQSFILLSPANFDLGLLSCCSFLAGIWFCVPGRQ